MSRDLNMFIDSLLIGTIVVVWLLIMVSLAIRVKDSYIKRNQKN